MNPKRNQGIAALPVVSSLGLIFTLTLLMLLRSGLMNRDQAAKTQLRNDYQQREETLLRAIVTVFPQAAISCLKNNYADSDTYSWNAIFAKAQTLASTTSALPPQLKSALGIETARTGNTGDSSSTQAATWITSLSGIAGTVTPGSTDYAYLFKDAKFAGKIPPLLSSTATLQSADALRPIVSTTKIYAEQVPGLLADITKYPLYNYIPYPNIRFGYAAPGQPIVAKQNWWAFAVTFGAPISGGTQIVQPVTKYYVLSLYEIPSQLPIEAATFAQIGTYKDGASWNSAAISITGGIYADHLALTNTYGSSRISGKQGISLAAPVTLSGTQIGNDFDTAGIRESLQVQSNTDILPIALSANSGRLNFQPIQKGTAFLKRSTDTPSSNIWDVYSNGGERCAITVKATAMVSSVDQTPTTIRVSFQTAAGTSKEVVLQRGVNWPTLLQAGGTILPFQTELTDSNHSCLTFYPTLLNAWLLTQGGASVSVNNAIHFRTDNTQSPLTVLPSTEPPTPDNMAVIIRKGQNLTTYTTGLSIVSPLRIYVGDDLNVTPLAAPPIGAALPASSVFYPPLSIFAAELRVGTTSAIRPFDLHGQISTLSGTNSGAWQPLDLKSGSDDTTHTDSIAAELKPLTSPAELPPVHQMNWLVVIEEISRN
ncbi:MAG: hypothetical protein WCO60_10645 [Verrucomicrobiota bacterium]